MVLGRDTLEVICCAYNTGALNCGRVLTLGDVKVYLEVMSRYALLTVELPHTEPITLTLWGSDSSTLQENSIRTCLGVAAFK